MNSIPPLSVTVSGRRRACVLDADLALHELGLLLASRICNEFDLWLVREFWEILDSTEAYLEHPQWLRPSAGRGHAPEATAQFNADLTGIFEQWETWRLESDLAGLKFYWIGDAMRESLLPKGLDHNVLHRYQVLARSLDTRIARLKPPRPGRRIGNEAEGRPYDTLTECSRDAAALAAALAHYQGFILTHTGDETASGTVDPKPAICRYLESWGVKCAPAGNGKASMEAKYLAPILAGTGVCELLWAGLNLSVVHLVVPKATIIPPARNDEGIYQEEFSLDEGKDPGETDWWHSAGAFYYSLRFV